MNHKFVLRLSYILALSLLCGCASLNKIGQKRFTVESSSLDWVQFSRTLVVNGAMKTVRLQLDGSGYLEYRTGNSSRVRDNFWQQSDSSQWRDLQTDHLVLSKEETLQFYQRLVDAGVYDTVRQTKEDREKSTLAILARIDFEKKLRLTRDPVFIKIFDDLMSKF